MPNIRRILAALCCLLLVVVAGCSSQLPGPERQTSKKPQPTKTLETLEGPLADIQVTGTWGTRPAVHFPAPLAITEPDTTVLVQGDGPRIKEGGTALLSVYAVAAEDGSVIRDDFETVPQAYRVTAAELGDDLFDTITGKRTGSRLLHVVNDTRALVLVIDVLPLVASGEPESNVPEKAADGATLPQVTSQKDGTPEVTIPKKGDPPSSLTTAVLIRGTGNQVLANETAVLQYQAIRWSKRKVVGSTWDDDSLPVTVKVGADTLIEGLDAALTDLPAGSRILVVVPPILAFGPASGKWEDETMVYVIDVLAASAPSDDSADQSDEDSTRQDRSKAADSSQERE